MEEIKKMKCIKTLNFNFISEKTSCLLCQSHGEIKVPVYTYVRSVSLLRQVPIAMSNGQRLLSVANADHALAPAHFTARLKTPPVHPHRRIPAHHLNPPIIRTAPLPSRKRHLLETVALRAKGRVQLS